MHRSHGHCMTMGTASTMASMVEALGMGLPGNAAYPAVDGRRNVLARMAGRRVVDMVHEDQKLSSILTRQAFENAIRTLAAIGGSTNAVIHLVAMAGRIGVPLTIEDFDKLGSEMPCLVNLQPSGKYLMEDFCYAGGLPAVMKEIQGVLHLDARTANGKTVGENIADAANYNPEVIQPLAKPFKDKAGIAVLRGNLAPRGAVIKPSAATPELMVHKGRAVVFEDIEDFHKRIDDENLDIDETCVMVLKNCGPKGYPGMAEVGNMPLPPKVLRKGITDMVRISDARMSGTAYGTVVLHTAPEAAAGGPLAIVRNGDIIELDVPNRKIHLHISDEELAAAPEGLDPAQAAAGVGLLEAVHRPRAAGRRGRGPGLPGGQARVVRASRQPLKRDGGNEGREGSKGTSAPMFAAGCPSSDSGATIRPMSMSPPSAKAWSSSTRPRAGQPNYLQGFGGDTSNAVIAAARAGARTAYLSRVGDDGFGRSLLDLWRREGVDTSAVDADPAGPPACTSSRTAGGP
jgi:dihydroxyacid dehydratase/phosphogluconate dehydratase